MNNYNENEDGLDYGILTEASKGVNNFLGDQTRRTVSRRTSHGFKNAFNLDISDETAEHIVHGGMVYSAHHLFSENGNRANGLLSLLALFALYHIGK